MNGFSDWRDRTQRIGALPHFGTARIGRKWFLVDMETGHQLGGATHNSKLECIAYAYKRDKCW